MSSKRYKLASAQSGQSLRLALYEFLNCPTLLQMENQDSGQTVRIQRQVSSSTAQLVFFAYSIAVGVRIFFSRIHAKYLNIENIFVHTNCIIPCT